jgi:hypothetical protein
MTSKATGFSMVPMATVEYVLAAVCDDDDVFEAAVRAAAVGLPWITSLEFDWINRIITFKGPVVPK